MEFGMIWIAFIGALLFLGVFYGRKVGDVRKKQQAFMAAAEEKREKYKVMTSEMFDEIPTNELTEAVIYRIMGKEDKMYEQEEVTGHIMDLLTHGEKLIYTIYQVELSLQNRNSSIHTFFIDDFYAPCRPYVEEAYSSFHCFELANLMKAAARLAEIIEQDLEDEENDIEGDYANYNFSDYTNELLSLSKSSGLVERAGEYIRSNKSDFIDIEETTKEGMIENEEGISE